MRAQALTPCTPTFLNRLWYGDPASRVAHLCEVRAATEELVRGPLKAKFGSRKCRRVPREERRGNDPASGLTQVAKAVGSQSKTWCAMHKFVACNQCPSSHRKKLNLGAETEE